MTIRLVEKIRDSLMYTETNSLTFPKKKVDEEVRNIMKIYDPLSHESELGNKAHRDEIKYILNSPLKKERKKKKEKKKREINTSESKKEVKIQSKIKKIKG